MDQFRDNFSLDNITSKESESIKGGKLKCINVPKSRWQLCGDTDFKTRGTVGVGIRF
jgi:hypothetical protein